MGMGLHAPPKSNRTVVESLYASLGRGDAAAVTALLAADLDWWFHGPRRCQHRCRLLTGEAKGAGAFLFAPARVAEVSSAVEGGDQWVVAEGWTGQQDYWVHAWCLRSGVITSFREYFNTSVTVRKLGRLAKEDVVWAIWRESQSPRPKDRSMPGLVLAI